ncbi:hypothetical protein GZ78_13365 [Endozoicomonas numazuensis]|uniref:Type I restriction modification DNA specificity domain-containing protein n=1 Tax=Endozoicomonas numazuensis TaxID=1137799 RepID=A0A081NJ48_9GAMM|nr:hypothetical protein GZ78_13365 [Endozoicomonas numazuensis]
MQLAVDSGQVPEGYKQTEVGVIPEDWSVKTVADIAEVIRGASPRPKGDKRYYGGTIPRLMVEDVTRDIKYVTPIVDSLTEEGAKKSRPCSKGTLTVVCSGTVGIPSILAVDACIHDGFLGLINLSGNINRDYLYHFFKTQQSKLNQSATHGGVFTNLTSDIVRNFVLPAPPFEEQQLISQVLSDIDTLITSLEKLIAKKRAIKTATMQQLLTGKKRLPEFERHPNGEPKGYKQTELGVIPEDWETPRLKEFCTLINGRGFKPHEWETEGLPIIRIQNLNGSEEFNYYSGHYDPKIFVKNNQLLFAWSGSRGTSFGPHVWKGGDALLNYHTWKLVVDETKVKETFFYFTLKVLTKEIEESAHGASALVHTQKGEMEQFAIPLPPSAKEQEAIAEVLSNIETDLNSLQTRLTKTHQLKQGMMQELLTGRTRLI